MSSRRQSAAAFSLLAFISDATVFGLVQRGFPGLHGEHGLQGRRRPFAVAGRHLGEHVAQEVHHAPLVPRLRQHRVHRGDQSRAPVADHEPDALQAAFDHAAKEPFPAGGILPHALGDADGLAVTILADADGDQDADVLHASAPGALVPHAAHEHVWVLALQRPRAPFVDLGVHALELVAQCLGTACGRPTATGRCRRPAWWTRRPVTCRLGIPRRSARVACSVR